MFRYRLHSPDGEDLGESTYAVLIEVGDEIIADKNTKYRVVDAVVFDDDRPMTDALQVEST